MAKKLKGHFTNTMFIGTFCLTVLGNSGNLKMKHHHFCLYAEHLCAVQKQF